MATTEEKRMNRDAEIRVPLSPSESAAHAGGLASKALHSWNQSERLPRPALGKQWEALPSGLAGPDWSLPASTATLGQPWKAGRTWPSWACCRLEPSPTGQPRSCLYFTECWSKESNKGIFFSSNRVAKSVDPSQRKSKIQSVALRPSKH